MDLKNYFKNRMKIMLVMVVVLFTINHSFAQAASYTSNPKFENEINSVLNYSVPVISVHDLKNMEKSVLILDARETEEYDLSRIPDAQYFGFDDPDFESLDTINKDKPIVLYCSIGYRSEKMGEKLQEAGFQNVYNLYGSIFEWANAGYELHDAKGMPTKKLHTYDRKWSKWVVNPVIEKTW